MGIRTSTLLRCPLCNSSDDWRIPGEGQDLPKPNTANPEIELSDCGKTAFNTGEMLTHREPTSPVTALGEYRDTNKQPQYEFAGAAAFQRFR